MINGTQPADRFLTLYFIAILYGLSLLVYFVSIKAGVPLSKLSALYMFLPLISVLCTMAFGKKKFTDLGLDISADRWLVLSILTPVAIAIGTLLVSLLLPNVLFDSNLKGLERYGLEKGMIQFIQKNYSKGGLHPLIVLIVNGAILGSTINACFAFGEEIGWRGFLERELRNWSFWKASILIGMLWGLWHFPLILNGHNYPDHRYIGMLFMLLFTILLSPILLLIRQQSGSVFTCSIFHGTFNSVAILPSAFVNGGSTLEVGVGGFAGLSVLLIMDVGIFFLFKQKIGYVKK